MLTDLRAARADVAEVPDVTVVAALAVARRAGDAGTRVAVEQLVAGVQTAVAAERDLTTPSACGMKIARPAHGSAPAARRLRVRTAIG